MGLREGSTKRRWWWRRRGRLVWQVLSGGSRDWAFARLARFGWRRHEPPLLNYSLGNAIIRHKGLSFASALWKPGDINCRGSLPSPTLVPPQSGLPPPPPRSEPPSAAAAARSRATAIPRITYSGAMRRLCPALPAPTTLASDLRFNPSRPLSRQTHPLPLARHTAAPRSF